MVIINGEKTEAEGKTVAAVLGDFGFDVARVAVELNGEILPKRNFSETTLHSDDKVEIVSFVGGG